MKKLSLLFSLLPLLLCAQNHGDTLRLETRLDQVYQQYNLSGKDVIVAMIERGIDYRHPDYIDANGNTRIAYLYDMIDQTGANAPNNPYGIGTIFTRAQIDAALQNNTNPPLSTDRHGHGTACTAIAAGDGSGMPGAPFRGVAPEATLIIVKVTHDAFPARNGVPAQAGFFNPDYIPVALQFVKDKTAELGLPSATLINLGSLGGSSDGTSEIARAMADFGGPGRILVCGAGDDGGGDNRAGGTVTQGSSLDLEIEKATPSGNLRLEIWYEGSDRFDVTITDPNNNSFGPYTSPATNQAADQQLVTGIRYYHRGGDVDFDRSTNGKRQILIDMTGAAGAGTYTIRLTGASITSGDFTASLNPSNFNYANRFKNNLVAGGSICDYASARNIIVPTSYVLKNNWIDINGVARRRTNEGNTGEIWVGSSVGPTRDGRTGVDFAVPGEVNMGAYRPNTYYASFDFLQVQGSNGLYGIQNAVSGAAPVALGTIALMLEVNPNLTPAQVKQILQNTARSDAFTGTTPNNTWGYGKLDALAAINAVRATVSVEPTMNMGLSLYPNPATDQLHYVWKKAGNQAEARILDLQGRLISTAVLSSHQGSISLQGLAKGVYLFEVARDGKRSFSRIVVQ